MHTAMEESNPSQHTKQKYVCMCIYFSLGLTKYIHIYIYIYIYVCFVCWLELDSSIALCNVEQFLNPICYFYQYFGPQWDLFQDIQLAFGLSSCKQCLSIWN